MAAVLEYLTSEVLELAVGVAEQKKRSILQPSHMNLGMRSDEELSKLVCSMTVSQGGQVSNINQFLLPKGKKGGADPSQTV